MTSPALPSLSRARDSRGKRSAVPGGGQACHTPHVKRITFLRGGDFCLFEKGKLWPFFPELALGPEALSAWRMPRWGPSARGALAQHNLLRRGVGVAARGAGFMDYAGPDVVQKTCGIGNY